MMYRHAGTLTHVLPWLKGLLAIAVLSAAVVFQGCGFQLRGFQQSSEPLAFKEISLTFSPDNYQADWEYQLRRALMRQGLTLSPAASTTLMITDLESERRTISYDRRGKAAEYLLTQTVSFECNSPHVAPGSKPLIATLTRSRVYTFDPQNIGGKSQEERILQKELKSELIQEILTQLVHYAQQTEHSGPKENLASESESELYDTEQAQQQSQP